MGRITLQQAANWCGGWIDPKYKDVTFLGANNDTRKLEKGQLFVALRGERDGHDFIPAALQKGAAGVLCTHCDGDYPTIVVEDTRIALGQIARGERERIGMKVVGITGSVGKSTTKEMVAAVLESPAEQTKGLCLNVNVPNIAPEEIKGIKLCRQCRGLWHEDFYRHEDPHGRAYFWLKGGFCNCEVGADDTDEWALSNGSVSVVPVQVDMTAYEKMPFLKEALIKV